MKKAILTFLLIALPLAVFGQQQTLRVGSKVSQVMIRNSNDEPVPLPKFGEKHLLIFYPDPDHANQNKKFTDYLEDNHIPEDHIHSFGVVNLKDAPLLPNGIVRSMLRKKEKKNGVQIYTDPDHLLRDAWGMGDVNNKFVFIFVTKEGIVEYFKKGELSEKDIEEFWTVVNKYK